jgi:hypothetical protein
VDHTIGERLFGPLDHYTRSNPTTMMERSLLCGLMAYILRHETFFITYSKGLSLYFMDLEGYFGDDACGSSLECQLLDSIDGFIIWHLFFHICTQEWLTHQTTSKLIQRLQEDPNPPTSYTWQGNIL